MITQAELKALIHYSPDTGHFTWLGRPLSMFQDKRRRNIWNARYAGKRAGSVRTDGYIGIMIHPTGYVAHRLAWLYVNGEFPAEHTDHINHQRADNRIKNLREVSPAENSQNRNRSKVNSSGYTGIYRKNGGWRAEIKTKLKRGRGPTRETIAQAIFDRLQLEKDFGFHPNHGAVI